MGPGGPSRASKYRKPAFAKALENHRFSKVLGVQGRPRQPWKTQEGSQEASEDLQHLKNCIQKKTQVLSIEDAMRCGTAAPINN